MSDFTRQSQGPGRDPLSEHPIDPTTPRAGFLATVENLNGAKSVRYFPTEHDAWNWVETKADHSVSAEVNPL